MLNYITFPTRALCLLLTAGILALGSQSVAIADAIIADHSTTDITIIPASAISSAKANLHIAYGHTSHGSQITDGMTGLVNFANAGGKGLSLPHDIFAWNNGGGNGALDLEEGSGWLNHDVGYYPNWVNETRAYLNDPSHADVNVIMWSWCGQVSNYSEQQMIDRYLEPMSQLETEYPNVVFVYMTGHADGSGETGNLHLRNQQIREYCETNGKVLFDFYDIECYDPDGNYYGDKRVNDACWYDSDGNGSRDRNWATEWQNAHTQGVDWYSCGSAHSYPINANQKAYAAWYLFARLAGWQECTTAPSDLTATPDYSDAEHVNVDLIWTDNSDAEDSYLVQRRQDEGPWTTLATLGQNAASYTDSDVSVGDYEYRVLAHVETGDHAPCNASSANVPVTIDNQTPPAAPSDLTFDIDHQNRSITVSFNDNSDNETGFRVWRKSLSQTWSDITDPVAVLDANTDSFVDEDLSPGTYDYFVEAFNSYGTGESLEAQAVLYDIPESPSNLSATADSANRQIVLTWDDNSDNETGFVIEWNENGTWNTLLSVAADVTTYTHSDLSDGTYTYRVYAYLSGVGNSLPCDTAVGVISNTAPVAPSNLTATLDGFNVTLTWQDNSENEEGFTIYQQIDEGSFFTQASTGPDVETWTINDLEPYKDYSFQVTAYNSNAESSASNTASVYVPQATCTVRLELESDMEDAFLQSGSPNVCYGETSWRSSFDRFIIRFNLPEAIMGKQIISADLGFFVWNMPASSVNQQLNIYQVTRNWTENEVTWNEAEDRVYWTHPGGDTGSLAGILTISNTSGNYDHEYLNPVDIKETVQAWADQTLPNYGVLLDAMVGTANLNFGLKASEYAHRPYLEITYSKKPECVTDTDEDGDVDGKDLSSFAEDVSAACLDDMADAFGQ